MKDVEVIREGDVAGRAAQMCMHLSSFLSLLPVLNRFHDVVQMMVFFT
jgi:hypothetical protein